MTKQELSRYSKQIILPEIGLSGQEKLAAARVLVIGAGGLGCPVLQYLAASGVGTIGIADGDNIEMSNLQRQVLYTQSETGKNKAAIAAEKLLALNPGVQVKIYPCFIDSSNVLEIAVDYDIVVDGSDNFATRYLVNDACVMLGKPMVSGAIYKFEGQVSVFNYKDGPTYRCIFPEPPGADESPNCADIGVVASLPGIIGTIQANEVIKMITGIGEVLAGRLLVMDTLTMNTHIFAFKLNPANKNITQLPDTSMSCDAGPMLIDYQELQRMMRDDGNIQLVDVREPHEHDAGNIGGINIPFSEAENAYRQMDRDCAVVLYCTSGIRSGRFARLLTERGYERVFSLANGVNGLKGN